MRFIAKEVVIGCAGCAFLLEGPTAAGKKDTPDPKSLNFPASGHTFRKTMLLLAPPPATSWRCAAWDSRMAMRRDGPSQPATNSELCRIKMGVKAQPTVRNSRSVGKERGEDTQHFLLFLGTWKRFGPFTLPPRPIAFYLLFYAALEHIFKVCHKN